MSMRPLRLESFEPGPHELDLITPQDHANQVQVSYQDGYASGWRDCDAQAIAQQARAELAALEAVQAITFTYAEASHAAEDACLKLLETVLDKVLAPLLNDAAITICIQEVRALVRAQRHDLVVRCAPSVIDKMSTLLKTQTGHGIQIQADDNLGDAQITLQLGAQARQIDPGAVLDHLKSQLSEAVAARTSAPEEQVPLPTTLPEAMNG